MHVPSLTQTFPGQGSMLLCSISQELLCVPVLWVLWVLWGIEEKNEQDFRVGLLLTNRRAYGAAQPGVYKSIVFWRVCGCFTASIFSLESLFSLQRFTVVPVNNVNCSKVMEHSLFYRIDSSPKYMKSLYLKAVGKPVNQLCGCTFFGRGWQRAGWLFFFPSCSVGWISWGLKFILVRKI